MNSQQSQDLNRRQFIKRASFIFAALPALHLGALAHTGCSDGNRSAASTSVATDDVPANLSWQTTITAREEPGEPMIISGTIYGPDGLKPVEGITLYVYHTDAKGYYSLNNANGQTARLRGWMKTNADGKYEFRSIKPASYPNSANPAHIHGTLGGRSYPVRWFEDYWFEGDPHISAATQSSLKTAGTFSRLVSLQKGSDGVWRGVRDFKLS